MVATSTSQSIRMYLDRKERDVGGVVEAKSHPTPGYGAQSLQLSSSLGLETRALISPPPKVTCSSDHT